jgi:osmotically-inducible protein OsmY
VGIVSRRDLVRLYPRSDDEICAAVVNDLLTALWIDPAPLTVSVQDGVVGLRGRVDRRTTASILAHFTRAVPGVVDIVDELTFEEDDGELPRPHLRNPFATTH